jgi:enoyl-CoA hydratase
MSELKTLLVDRPADYVSRITLNRPEKRNALSNELRRELFQVLEQNDVDEKVRVTIVRGAGVCFSSGYDLSGDISVDQPYFTAKGDGAWSRHVTEGWLKIADLAKPVISQVHGYAMAGGSELAAACDLMYVAEDAQIGYPVVRMLSPPDWQFHPWLMNVRDAMEMMLTGDSLSGVEAVASGMANKAYKAEELDEKVLERACMIAKIPSDLNQINKRVLHRALEIMGARAAMRSGSELMALATHQESTKEFLKDALNNLKKVFDKPK